MTAPLQLRSVVPLTGHPSRMTRRALLSKRHLAAALSTTNEAGRRPPTLPSCIERCSHEAGFARCTEDRSHRPLVKEDGFFDPEAPSIDRCSPGTALAEPVFEGEPATESRLCRTSPGSRCAFTARGSRLSS